LALRVPFVDGDWASNAEANRLDASTTTRVNLPMKIPRDEDKLLRPSKRRTMPRILRTLRTVLLGAAAAAFVVTPQGQSILGPPSEANHFIGTPKGWVHPKTPWGEPDIQANLNMMQAAGIPLERCANATRFGGPPCDMNKAWGTEEEFKQRAAPAAGRRAP